MKSVLKFKPLLLSFVVLSSVVFIHGYSHLFLFTKEALGKYFPVKWILMAHVLGGATALLIGPFQFVASFRRRAIHVHRWLGRIYLLGVLLSASGALFLTFVTTDQVGRMYTVSLWFLAFVWSGSSVLAYWTIRRRNVQEHEEWMVRSYLITFAFVVQNYVLKIPALLALAPFQELSPNIFWFSWSVPLFGYQVYLTWNKVRMRALARPARTSSR